MKLAHYQASVPTFLNTSTESIMGELAGAHGFALELQQKRAWRAQVEVLRSVLARHRNGTIFFEFSIPRMGKRADVVLVVANKIFVLEFKVGAETFDRSALDQVHDYALDLKNFHAGSHDAWIVPVLVATEASSPVEKRFAWAEDRVAEPILSAPTDLADLLRRLGDDGEGTPIDTSAWLASGYKPTPTIIEAAQALYQHHGVEEITRSDAGAKNLAATTNCLQRIIEDAKATDQKVICFVTGVPGAGKTLAGLNIATKRAEAHVDEHAVFLSGNGPLVEVLREALARDKAARSGGSKQNALREVRSFIQPIHHFRDEALRHERAPIERVVVFDEAQRAWTRDKAVKFMKERGRDDFDASEPEFLISVMDRHQGWCVIVCLVGGGQEINTGEAGLSEWLTSLEANFPHWRIHLSERLSDPDYVPREAATLLRELPTQEEPDLHLAVSMRSFRAESLSEWVSHVVENRPDQAHATYGLIAARYPIALTRDLDTARSWLRSKARGSERFGVLASSGGRRLRPEGIDVRSNIDAAAWFLNDSSDVRSSFYCEDIATEFDIQGLELDWCAVAWDADFRRVGAVWHFNEFRGTRWQSVRSNDNQLYLKNAYRVLLTRARQGMVIFVPRGSTKDPTRPPAFYDATYSYLLACGVREL